MISQSVSISILSIILACFTSLGCGSNYQELWVTDIEFYSVGMTIDGSYSYIFGSNMTTGDYCLNKYQYNTTGTPIWSNCDLALSSSIANFPVPMDMKQSGPVYIASASIIQMISSDTGESIGTLHSFTGFSFNALTYDSFTDMVFTVSIGTESMLLQGFLPSTSSKESFGTHLSYMDQAYICSGNNRTNLFVFGFIYSASYFSLHKVDKSGSIISKIDTSLPTNLTIIRGSIAFDEYREQLFIGYLLQNDTGVWSFVAKYSSSLTLLWISEAFATGDHGMLDVSWQDGYSYQATINGLNVYSDNGTLVATLLPDITPYQPAVDQVHGQCLFQDYSSTFGSFEVPAFYESEFKTSTISNQELASYASSETGLVLSSTWCSTLITSVSIDETFDIASVDQSSRGYASINHTSASLVQNSNYDMVTSNSNLQNSLSSLVSKSGVPSTSSDMLNILGLHLSTTIVIIIVVSIGILIIALSLIIKLFIRKLKRNFASKYAHGDSSSYNLTVMSTLNDFPPSHISGKEQATATETFSNYSDISTTMSATMFDGSQALALPGFLCAKSPMDFRIRKQIGQGGTANIHVADAFSEALKERADGYPILIKILNESADEDMQVGFMQEISILYLLHQHRNIAKIVGYCNEPLGILMRYYILGSVGYWVHGKSTHELARRSQVSKLNVVRILKDLCVGISAMHSLGIVHCDIKPDNALLDADMPSRIIRGILTDFGISQIVEAKVLLVKSFQLANLEGVSVYYACPEAIYEMKMEGELPYTPPHMYKSRDVYSLGMLMFEMVTRKLFHTFYA